MNILPEVSVPSITRSAMICELRISCWVGRKKDRSASTKVTQDNSADRGTASVNKKLLGNCDELSAIQKFVGNARNTHYSLTLPWGDLGQRLLPTSRFFDYQKTMGELESEFGTMVKEFVGGYTSRVNEAQLRLGSLFNPSDYPSARDIENKFSWGLDFTPVPETNDWRVDIGLEGVNRLKVEYNQHFNRMWQGAQQDIVDRTRDKVSRMVQQLGVEEGSGKNRKFKQSLVPNVTEVVSMLRDCNLTGDLQLSALCDKLEATLEGVTVDGLRANQGLRDSTRRSMSQILDSLPSLDL